MCSSDLSLAGPLAAQAQRGAASAAPADQSGAGDAVARGKYIVENVAVCGRCHSPLDASGQRDRTNVMVVSDHGFSTIVQTVDVLADISQQGIPVGGGFLQKPDPGTVVAVTLGGLVNFYVIGRDRALTERLVRFLQTTAYAGVLFTREKNPGTFGLTDAGMEGPEGPDVVMAMRWSADVPGPGLPPGLVTNSSTSYGPQIGRAHV